MQAGADKVCGKACPQPWSGGGRGERKANVPRGHVPLQKAGRSGWHRVWQQTPAQKGGPVVAQRNRTVCVAEEGLLWWCVPRAPQPWGEDPLATPAQSPLRLPFLVAKGAKECDSGLFWLSWEHQGRAGPLGLSHQDPRVQRTCKGKGIRRKKTPRKGGGRRDWKLRLSPPGPPGPRWPSTLAKQQTLCRRVLSFPMSAKRPGKRRFGDSLKAKTATHRTRAERMGPGF